MQPPLSDLQPIGEWRPDVEGPFGAHAVVVKNCISDGGEYIPISTLVAAGIASLGGVCRGACAVRDSNGNVHVFAGTATKLYKLNGTEWTDVTRTLGGDYTMAENERWVFTQYGDRLIAADYTDDTQYFDLGLSSNFAELPDAPKCRAMTVVNNFVMMVNTFDDVDQSRPKRTRWSGLDNTEAWTPSAATQSDFQDLEDSSGEALAVVGYQNYAVILKRDAIIRAQYVEPPKVFTFETAETNQGTIGGNTVAVWGRRIFYLAEDGFYMFDGQGSRQIGYKKVDRTFLADVKPGSIPKITTAINPLRKVVAWSYVSSLSPNGLPDKMLVFNWVDERWTLVEEDVAQAFISLQVGKTIEDLEDEYGDLEDVPLSLDSPAYAGGATLPAAFNHDGDLGYFNGEPMEATFETREARLNIDGRSRVQAIQVISDAAEADVYLVSRQLPNGAESTSSAFVQSSATGEYCGRVDAMFHRARIVLRDWSYLRGLQFRAVSTGSR